MAVVRRAPAYQPTQLLDGDVPVVVTPDETAAMAASKPAHLTAMLLSLLLVAGGAAGAYAMRGMSVPTVEMAGQMSVWASLFAFSVVVERVLEPFTRWLPGRSSRHRFEQAMVAMENGRPGGLTAAARSKADMDQSRLDRSLLAWGLAVGLATVISAAAGLYLLRMVIADPAWSTLPTWVDALLTGLVVGSGTKPVHDLVSRIQPS